jgi:hypothetical protein
LLEKSEIIVGPLEEPLHPYRYALAADDGDTRAINDIVEEKVPPEAATPVLLTAFELSDPNEFCTLVLNIGLCDTLVKPTTPNLSTGTTLALLAGGVPVPKGSAPSTQIYFVADKEEGKNVLSVQVPIIDLVSQAVALLL